LFQSLFGKLKNEKKRQEKVRSRPPLVLSQFEEKEIEEEIDTALDEVEKLTQTDGLIKDHIIKKATLESRL